MAAIVLDHVTKRFGDKVAVSDLSLEIRAGAFVGLLGRNGAGKSTTLKMLTGLLAPTSGTIRLLGRDFEDAALDLKRRIGVMPEDMALLEMLTGAQYLRFVGRMYGLEDDVIDERRKELFEKLDLTAGPRTVIADYSFGMKKKVALSAALIHGPEVIFLDEPFEGIDPVTSRTIKDILAALRRRGTTILLTSHILEIVEKLCEEIAILEKGELLGFGTLEDLRKGTTLEAAFVELVGGARAGELSWLT
ncbi:MAG TPA: ABC transporter ATP-binding protein [Polyangiaceae bacterium]|jgi:ABC-2 type transport system ATP-binding protein